MPEEEPVEFAQDEYGNEVVLQEFDELTCFSCRKTWTSYVCLTQVSPTQVFTIRDGVFERIDRSRSPRDARQTTNGRHRYGDAMENIDPARTNQHRPIGTTSSGSKSSGAWKPSKGPVHNGSGTAKLGGEEPVQPG